MIRDHLSFMRRRDDWTPGVVVLVVGLALAAIAEVINRGVALRSELDTVI